MRIIEFRGKKKSNGEWAYGSLISIPEGSFIWNEQVVRNQEIFGLQPVIPETVGQFTEYITDDKNKLFEGDIVKRTCNEKTVPFTDYKYACDAWEIGVVRYNKKATRFEVNVTEQQDLWYGSLPHAGNIRGYGWKIIGNMTDNPGIISVRTYKNRKKS